MGVIGMHACSVRQYFGKRVDAEIDTFLFRTLFVLMVLSQALPKPIEKSESRFLYYPLVFLAFAVNAAIYVFIALRAIFSKAKAVAALLLRFECRVEFYLRTHHFILLALALFFAAKLFSTLP